MSATAGTSNVGIVNIVSFEGTTKTVPLVGDFVIIKDSLTGELKKATVSSLIGVTPAVVYKGVIDASTNPNYPAADSGDLYVISVAGKIGGASGVVVEAGDMIICKVDGSAAGDQAAVGANWNIIQGNIDGAVIGPASATDTAIALYDGVTGKLIKNSAATIDGSGNIATAGTVDGIDVGTDVANNTTHRGSDGKDHSDVVTNNAKISYTDAVAVGLNTTHRTSAGTDHSDVGLNNTHRTSAGTDHSDVGLNNTHRGSTSNPHSVTKAQVSLTNVDDIQQMPLSYLDTDGALAANSDVKVASQKATKTYIDNNKKYDSIPFSLGGNGFAITTGIKGDIPVPFDCTIVGVEIVADQTGSIVIDLWKDTYANFPPTDADSITAAAPITISAAIKSQDLTLTGWTKSLTKGEWIRINVDSCSTIQKVTVNIQVTKS